MATDPVCGMTVEEARAAATAEHKGKRYYFCSQHCLAKFEAEPAKYAAVEKPPAPACKPVSVEYTCPMHPEVRSDAPGNCPKCGMALVPVAAAEEDHAELRAMTRRFWLSAVLSAPLAFIAMAPYFGVMHPFGLAPQVRALLEFALGTPVVLWGGWPFFRKFALSLRNRSPNMYTLIGLGVGVAYAYSVAGCLRRGCSPRSSAWRTARSAPISRRPR
jgi:Cu+-exporting ATPase